MNKKISILLFSGFFCIVGCNAKVIESNKASKIKVQPCGFDYDIDNYYCKVENIKLYENNIGKSANYNKNYTVIKIDDGKYIRLVALNQKTLIIYPLNYKIEKEKSQIKFTNSNENLCVTGDLYSYRNTYNDSKVCFRIIEDAFVKISIDENIKDLSLSKFKQILLPNSSDYFNQCLKINSQNKCEKLSDSENHIYRFDEIKKNSKEIGDILNNEKIKKLNLDGFKFLPYSEKSQYLIGEKYEDTDEESSCVYYLIKIKPDIEARRIGNFYSIDKQFNLSYSDSSGNKKNIKLEL
ncbi:hypothetical protein [Acinetobacter sp. ANC 3781]|jgi:hypothetical protein|uniref:hypothetical protein n=1 Tax=Acinetobacter sp. ANC 3781 TaxID=2529835 RepID=UPI00202F574E|nr:hypothetical protein [Acinetobacter sp. ANC 3781]